jgi:hypothetical protein
MFRPSDILPARPHESYTNKPVPLFQKHQQISSFNEYDEVDGNFTGYSASTVMPEAIPSTVDSIYDPDHPDADWSGFVAKKPERRHVQGHISQQIGIQHTENGIVSKEERDEYGRKRRVENKLTMAHANLIGGLPPNDDPWKSNYQRFANQDSTSIDQYSTAKQHSSSRRTSKAQSQDGPPTIQIQDHSQERLPRIQAQSKAVYGSHSRSLVNDLYSSLVDQVGEYKVKFSPKRRPDATLITENYKGQLPGYTGRRPTR